MIQQLIFAVALCIAGFFFYKSVKRIWGTIKLGRPTDRTDNKAERWKQVFLIALGQKKMFKRPIPAILHLMVYVSFLIVNIELLEILIDGLFGTHRVFSSILGSFYVPVVNFFEFFAVLVIISCVIFFIRRNIVRLKRFHSAEMGKWPSLDGNLILVFEIVLMVFLLNMNATETALSQKLATPLNSSGGALSLLDSFVGGAFGSKGYFFSNLFVPLYEGASVAGLQFAERFYWWAHILGIFAFANYVPYSKHLHIFLAFPTTYYANLEEKGKMENMPVVTNEVKIMMGLAQPEGTPEMSKFGAKDVTDLSEVNILNALTCTECGRCTSNCPANITGKELSPRKIMMDVRDRAEELHQFNKTAEEGKEDGKSLFDFVKDQELYACTSCNACTETCPINIDPMSIILELRRYRVMEESKGPNEWTGMYGSLETTFNPWKFPSTDRQNWRDELDDKES